MRTRGVVTAVLVLVASVGCSGGPAAQPAAGPDATTAATSEPSYAPARSNPLSDREQRALLDSPPGRWGFQGGEALFALLRPGARWDPCSPVEMVWNPTDAPEGALRDLRTAVDRVAEASGLDLRLDRPVSRPAYRTYGERSDQPVLVTWGEDGDGALWGRQADRGGAARPTYVVNARGQEVWVSGQITFDLSFDARLVEGFGTAVSRVAVYMHEVAHLLGLDHVDDEMQLMHPTSGALDLGAGDLAGLRRLSEGPCRPAD
ncbi:matrixin family metalloprotease [Nocardioides sp. CFH 31398]|uniref:matrixin family metalloprotease n=1 Tax=Nocardioides sp. CFH 31398 TaxID=2919579 RepID=UPI001F06E21D|nr:matrixin family metalloprotease [Nocardioides sp. CFH 31398]MCH1865062.1 M10 family metallopeptidase domain-containing protein [Nocardioides sp. CFH 31398]